MNLSHELSSRAGAARRRWLYLALLGVYLVIASGGIGLAQESEESSYSEDTSSSTAAPAAEEAKSPAYVMPYALTIACVGLGLMLVCRSANRQSLTKKWKGVGLSAHGEEAADGKKGPAPRGPRPCPEAQSALVLSIVALFIPIVGFVSLPKASAAKRIISQNPGMTGDGKANAAKIISIVALAIWALNVLGYVLMALMSSGGGAAG